MPKRYAIAGLAVVIVLIAIVSVLQRDSTPTETGSTDGATSTVTELGCDIEQLGGDANYVDPFCTEPALIERYCGIASEDILVPPHQELVGDIESHIYTTPTTPTAVQFRGDTGANRIICPDAQRSTYEFTAEEWSEFLEPEA